VAPILDALIGETARLFLSPCCRMLFWQTVAIRRTLRGKRARFATWAYRRNRDKCANLRDEQCSAAEAADRVLAVLVMRRDPIVQQLLEATPERRREVPHLIGPATRSALYETLRGRSGPA
jgi:hypothetical protein